MAHPVSRRQAVVGIVLAVAIIVHGSLWPYEFEVPPGPGSALHTLANSWTDRPSSLGDILGNLLFYMPLGLSVALATRGRVGVRFLLIALAGACLSTGMELLQFY